MTPDQSNTRPIIPIQEEEEFGTQKRADAVDSLQPPETPGDGSLQPDSKALWVSKVTDASAEKLLADAPSKPGVDAALGRQSAAGNMDDTHEAEALEATSSELLRPSAQADAPRFTVGPAQADADGLSKGSAAHGYRNTYHIFKRKHVEVKNSRRKKLTQRQEPGLEPQSRPTTTGQQ